MNATATSSDSRAISRALQYIGEHLCDRLTLGEVAQAACLSRFYFARVFRASTGQSPMGFVLHARVELARDILAHSDQKIAVTAASLGFFDESHFTRTFRRMTGMSPRMYSRLQRSGCPSGAAIRRVGG